ncbi:hypothetical protein FRB90_009885 [Tulasnella sp. 427]|nr:hypothetical protein FRB90_009885 [Tulasnella sp. 427]
MVVTTIQPTYTPPPVFETEKAKFLRYILGKNATDGARNVGFALAREDNRDNPAAKELLIFDTCRAIFNGVLSVQTTNHPLWAALRKEKLVEKLFHVLIRQDARFSRLCTQAYLDWGVGEILKSLEIIVLSEPWRQDRELRKIIRSQAAVALSVIDIWYSSPGRTEPSKLYEIQSLAVTVFGTILIGCGSTETLSSYATSGIQNLTKVALSTIFDPLADPTGAQDDLQKLFAQTIAGKIVTLFVYKMVQSASAGSQEQSFRDLGLPASRQYAEHT